jgi:hypothetical protein
MISHRNILTEEQMTYAIKTSKIYAYEIAKTVNAADAAADFAEAAAPAEPAEAVEVSDSDETASKNGETPASAVHLQCAVCGKKYRYPRALQTHLATSGHGQVANINVVQNGEALDTQSPARDIKKELELVSYLLYPLKGRDPLIDGAPLMPTNDRMIFTPHISNDIGALLSVSKTVEPVGLPQLDGKAADILLYQFMLNRRVSANEDRLKALRREAALSPLKPGECFFCRTVISDMKEFYTHAVACSKMKGATCEYCDQTFANSTAKSRHMHKCSIYRMCTTNSMSQQNPTNNPMNLKRAEAFAIYLVGKSLTDPSMQGTSLLSEFSVEKYNEWMKLN